MTVAIPIILLAFLVGYVIKNYSNKKEKPIDKATKIPADPAKDQVCPFCYQKHPAFFVCEEMTQAAIENKNGQDDRFNVAAKRFRS